MRKFKGGDKVYVFQMSPSKGLFIEGRATVVGRKPDYPESYYDVRFDNEPENTYQRFLDAEGQLHPDGYVREFNKRIGVAA